MNAHLDVGYEERFFYSGGHKLHGRLYRPAEAPRAVAVLHGATGVPHRFYRDFAKWLAETQDIACLTYDYRDFGASARGPMKASNATMADWGVHDQQVARDHLRNSFPDIPLWVIGHSLGGFMLPFQKDLNQIDRVITVASGPAHVTSHPFPYRFLAATYWYLTGPIATFLAGYMPGKRLRLGDDIPSGVFWQWRRWCTSRGFFAAEIGNGLPMPDWTGLKAPLKVVAIRDDVLIPPATIWKLMQFYPEAPKTQLTIDPLSYDLEQVGHIAAFSAKNRALWPDLIA